MKRSFRHWTPGYVRDRIASAVYRYRQPDAPWLTPAMTWLLSEWLRPEDVGFEWGSGRSTVWLARRTLRLTSVEHDEVWHARVREALRAQHVSHKVDCILADTSEPTTATRAYAGAIDGVPPSSLDYCLVDGQLRDLCALRCLSKLRPGGLLIIDNANWYFPRRRPSRAPNARTEDQGWPSPTWEEVGEAVCSWRSVWTTNGVFDSALWQKPPEGGVGERPAGGRRP